LQADAMLAAVKREKGRFAQALAKEARGVLADGIEIKVPTYIDNALDYVCLRRSRRGMTSPVAEVTEQAPRATADDHGPHIRP
jgi:hypothetical protein